ncbi:Uma2 family endonuclease [Dethiobacter alkaliphilus]|uniref:Uma2 family endonuclease n=1 Tax=Dethiobacter alkaliphilus TaxID=427926 RepID=UPI0022273F77|nr:Uma2 family endonuclease [Dethiobacter alkaliphilus]MCW3490649.1 Uma2 family endonuclease [Dethiobacter alkaliphilus]
MSYDKELITAQALAAALNLSVETIWRYTREKKIPYVELGKKQYRYNLEDVVKALSTSSVREKTVEYNSDKKYTYEDYLQLPEEPGYRFEILEGTLVKEPSPNVMHQRVSRRLQRILEDYFWQIDSKSEIFDAPLDVTFGNITVVQPDLLYVAGEQTTIVKKTRIDGAPKLAVEILSPSTSRKDRMQKRQIYQKAGVQHYWLVSPEDKTFECFVLRDGFYAVAAQGMDDEVLEHPNFPGLSVPLKELWRDPSA